MERHLKGARLGNPLATNGFGVPTIVEEEDEEEGEGTNHKQERLRRESLVAPLPQITSSVHSAAAVLDPVPPPVATRLNSWKGIPPPPPPPPSPPPPPAQPMASTSVPALKPASAGGLLPDEEDVVADMGDTTEEDYPLLRLDYRLSPVSRHSQEARRRDRTQVAGAAGVAPGRITTPGSDPTDWKCHKGHIKKKPLQPDSQERCPTMSFRMAKATPASRHSACGRPLQKKV
ncbi:unnamed protein product [Schistocephalus solidus]|uniref:Uncharacterized protein n=1 Tax=Schistocephalus solidus TaxID=70667 RepID=A0A183SEV9_SCHSO|nr:unnamed protein product [Schistocephalus solidus]